MTLMQPKDVAEVVIFAATRPNRVNMNNIMFRPVEQAN